MSGFFPYIFNPFFILYTNNREGHIFVKCLYKNRQRFYITQKVIHIRHPFDELFLGYFCQILVLNFSIQNIYFFSQRETFVIAFCKNLLIFPVTFENFFGIVYIIG